MFMRNFAIDMYRFSHVKSGIQYRVQRSVQTMKLFRPLARLVPRSGHEEMLKYSAKPGSWWSCCNKKSKTLSRRSRTNQ